MGRKWPYQQIDEFDTARFQPIWHAAKEHVDDLPPNADGASLYSVKPVFFPHDGIRPFWNLASYSVEKSSQRPALELTEESVAPSLTM